MDFNYLFTSFDGRINRAKWWIGILIIAAVGFIVSLVLLPLFGIGFMGRLVSLIVQVILFYPAYAVGAKRFQDRDKPSSYALVGPGASIVYGLMALVGLVGDPVSTGFLDGLFGIVMLVIFIWYVVDLGIMKGTDGANQYGPDPLAGR